MRLIGPIELFLPVQDESVTVLGSCQHLSEVHYVSDHCAILSGIQSPCLSKQSLVHLECSSNPHDFYYQYFNDSTRYLRYLTSRCEQSTNKFWNVLRVSVRVGEHNIKTSIDCQLQKNGMNKCNPPVQDLNVEKIIPHPGFNADFTDNDIGLVKVSRMNLLKGKY